MLAESTKAYPWLAHMKDKTQSKMERKHNTGVTGGNMVEPILSYENRLQGAFFSDPCPKKRKESIRRFIEPQQKFPKKHIPSVFVNLKEIWPTVILLNIVARIVTLLRASSQLVTDVERERPLT